MPSIDEMPAAIARLEVRLENFEARFDRHERDIETKLADINRTVADLNKLAMLGRVAMGVVLTIGAGAGWLLSQWNAVKAAVGK